MYNETGTYGTELFTREADKVINDHDSTKPLFLYFAQQAVHVGNENQPLQAPQKYLDRLGYIGDEKRRTYAGMKGKRSTCIWVYFTRNRFGLRTDSLPGIFRLVLAQILPSLADVIE